MERISGIKPSDTAALIYTSGTTGNPKGVVLTHDNFDYELECIGKLAKFNPGDGYVSWLPCAHVFGQVADNHLWIRDAMHMTVVDSPLHSIDYCKEAMPALFIGVPRIYEKVYSNLVAGLPPTWLLSVPGLGGLSKRRQRKDWLFECQVCSHWSRLRSIQISSSYSLSLEYLFRGIWHD